MLVETNGSIPEEPEENAQALSDDDKEQFQEENEENQDENNVTEEQQANKRVKMEKKDKPSSKVKESKTKSEKSVDPLCEICFQKLNDKDLRLYIGHPNDAVDEYSVLLDPKLCLFNGDEIDITEGDARALNKVTGFR